MKREMTADEAFDAEIRELSQEIENQRRAIKRAEIRITELSRTIDNLRRVRERIEKREVCR